MIPTQTVYAKGLNEKVRKPELKRSLYNLFSTYGEVVDVVALKTMKMRGQAHIVFDEISSATAALRILQGFPFYDRPLQLEYAKSKSNVIALRDGTFVLGSKKENDTTATSMKRSHGEDEEPPSKRLAKEESDSGSDMEASDDEEPVSINAPSDSRPNKILFVQNVPSNVNSNTLTSIFKQYPGFKEVRIVEGKSDIAFSEYETEQQANVARNALNGFNLTGKEKLIVNFAK